MSAIYRKSFKGIDEVAFKTTGLPMRMMSYLLVVDGETSVDQLTARHPQLPSLAVVLQGLLEQGYLELVAAAANVVEMPNSRVANGAPMSTGYPQPMQPASPAMSQQTPMMPANMQPGYNQQTTTGYSSELEIVKGNMVRDVSALLGSDAAPVIQKIQGCRTRDDLFAAMMGIKKIISIYADRNAADKFSAKYQSLAQ
jgi:hypothetical protein